MIRRDERKDMDRGEDRATAHANRLQRQTDVRHRAVRRSWTGLVGGADWWEVQQRVGYVFWRHVVSYGAGDGVRLDGGAS